MAGPDTAPVAQRRTILLDVDNTLIDNDAAKDALRHRLAAVLGAERAASFWEMYETVRAETGGVNLPLTLDRLETGWAAAGSARSIGERAALAAVFTEFPYADYRFPGTLATLAALRQSGQPIIFSDGDPVFQVRKIWRAGLATAVDGAVMVFDRKVDRLREAAAFYPAAQYVIVDDKPAVLAAARATFGAKVVTVQMVHGHYATAAAGAGAIDVRITAIEELPAYLAALPSQTVAS